MACGWAMLSPTLAEDIGRWTQGPPGKFLVRTRAVNSEQFRDPRVPSAATERSERDRNTDLDKLSKWVEGKF